MDFLRTAIIVTPYLPHVCPEADDDVSCLDANGFVAIYNWIQSVYDIALSWIAFKLLKAFLLFRAQKKYIQSKYRNQKTSQIMDFIVKYVYT